MKIMAGDVYQHRGMTISSYPFVQTRREAPCYDAADLDEAETYDLAYFAARESDGERVRWSS